jgi:excisionase family DNA binding protein
VTERAYSVKQVSEMLGIRTHGVLALIRSGQLRGVDVALQPGGRPHWRIMADDLEAFITGRTYAPAAPRRRRRKPTTVKQYF